MGRCTDTVTSAARCHVFLSDANWPDCSAAKVKKGRIKSGAAEFLADFEQKGPKRARIFKKIVFSLLLSSIILGKYPKNIVIFPLTQTKIVFSLNPNSFKKVKLQGDRIFPQKPNFFFGRKGLKRVGNTGILGVLALMLELEY